MIEALITVILILALFQESNERRYPALIFAFFIWFHCVFFSHLEGLAYSVTAAFCDVMIISLIALFARITKVSDTIMAISCVSIIMNLNGWLLYSYGLNVEIYNYSIAALYFIAILSLLRKDCANDYARITKRYRSIRLSFAKCGAFFKVLPKEAGL